MKYEVLSGIVSMPLITYLWGWDVALFSYGLIMLWMCFIRIILGIPIKWS